MTVIKLSAAILASLKAGDSVVLADENGKPLYRSGLFPITPIDCEPTDEELAEAENDPVDYTLTEAWEKIRRGETL